MHRGREGGEKVRPAVRPLEKLPDEYPMYVHVRNTFVDTGAEALPVLKGFYRESGVRTCPANRIGLMKNLFQEVVTDSDSTEGCHTPPDSDSTAGTADPQPRLVLSLASSISPHREQLPELLVDSEEEPPAEPLWQAAPPPPATPALGSWELPSIGSAGHAVGRCKPCAFFHTVGCGNAVACTFCHLCESGEKKRRRKEKLDARRLRKAKRESAARAR